MKLYLSLLLLLITFQVVAQTYPITGINISLPANPDANTANWGSGTSMFTITSTSKTENGRIVPHVMESKILVTIKKGGTKVCGSYTSNTAPESNFNTLTKVWSGTNAVSLLGQDCVLPPGDYEICVQFFGYGAAGVVSLSEEKTKVFAIRAVEQQVYQAPQAIAPADGTIMSAADVKKPILFRWAPVIPRPHDLVTYRLTVWQLMQGQTGTQAMQVNQPIITKDVDNMTQAVIYMAGDFTSPQMLAFVWNVQALNKEGNPIGGNNGTSGAIGFNFKNGMPVENPEEKKGGNVCKDFSVVFMEDRKIYRGDSFTYECTITNNYRGDEQANRPKSFRIKLNNDLVIAVVDNVAKGWTRTPSKFPPGSSQIKWTNNSGDIPNGETKLGSICFEHVKTGPITVIYEWLNKDEKVICSESIDLARSPVGTSGGNTITIGDGKKFDPQPSDPSPIPHAIAFKIAYTTDNQLTTSNRPTFEWKTEKAEVGVSYSIVVREIPKKGAPESGVMVLERSNIHENTLPYPKDAPNLDSTKSYEWQVSMIENGKLLGKTPFIGFNFLKILDKVDEKLDARKYYELGKEPFNTITKIPNKTLDVQFYNKYASAENIKLTIYDAETQKIKRKSKDVIKLNSVTGLNRISIDIKDYNLEPGRLYLLTISDSHSTYHFNFKVTNDREK